MKSTPHVSGQCVHRQDLKHINDIKSSSWRETLRRDLNPFLFGLRSIIFGIFHPEVPDWPIIHAAEAQENALTVTCSANGLPVPGPASWCNSTTTTVRLLGNAVSHTPARGESCQPLSAAEAFWMDPCGSLVWAGRQE